MHLFFERLTAYLAATVMAAIIFSTEAYAFDKEYSLTTGIVRSDDIDEGDIDLRKELQLEPFLRGAVRTSTQLKSGAKLEFGAFVEAIGHPEIQAPIEYRGGGLFDLRNRFGENNNWNYRFYGGIETKIEEGEWIFSRGRVGGRLGFRHNKSHSTTGGLRLGYRNQNEGATFDGYDQAETLLDLTHIWRPWEDRRSLSATIFAETRRADNERYSYNEVGMRFAARFPLDERTEVIGRLRTYSRTYNDASSFPTGRVRKDARFQATIGLEREFSEGFMGEAYVGWDNNTSTHVARAFSGPVFGIILRKTWN